jgi:hypothetical protein
VAVLFIVLTVCGLELSTKPELEKSLLKKLNSYEKALNRK